MFVSVIMSVFNGEKYLNEAIDSILDQSHKDFEFLIVDDCSTDSTNKILHDYEKKDSRVILIENTCNTGLTKSLNIALKCAKGKYILRMDADDVALPDRFEKQIIFMEKNQDIVLSGANVKCIGKKSNLIVQGNDTVRNKYIMLMHTVINHPTFIIRSDFLQKYHISYNEKLRYAQDYFMIYQVMKYGKIGNLDEVLLLYRRHVRQISDNKLVEQNKCAFYTRMCIFRDMGIHLTKREKQHWKNYTDIGTKMLTYIDFFYAIIVFGKVLFACRNKEKEEFKLAFYLFKEDLDKKRRKIKLWY